MQLREKLRGSRSNGKYMRDAAMDNASMLSNEFKSFVSDVEGMLKRSGRLQGDELEHAKDQMSKRVTEAKAVLDESSHSLMRRARRSATEARGYAQSHPWEVAGATLAVGLLCGILFSRR